MSIPLAGWILSLVAFVLGTITPFIYRTFFHEGISIKPLDARVIVGSGHGLGQGQLIFGTVVRMANASGKSILIDDIRVKDLKLGNYSYVLKSAILADVTESRDIHLPIWHDDASAVLPMILKQDETKVYALQLDFDYGGGDADAATDEFSCVYDRPFSIAIRINGKYRTYELDFARRQPIFGFNVTIGAWGPGK